MKDAPKDLDPPAESRILSVPLDLVDPDPEQPRTGATDVSDLVESMGGPQGLLSPIVLRPHPDPEQSGRFLVVFGHRRREAAISLGWPAIQAVVKAEYADWKLRTRAQLDENERRQGVGLWDRCQYLLRRFQASEIKKQKDFAEALRLDPGDLSLALQAANATGSLADLIKEGWLTNLAYLRIARSLPSETLAKLLQDCRRTKKPLSNRVLEEAGRSGQPGPPAPPASAPPASITLRSGDRLRRPVSVTLAKLRPLLSEERIASLLTPEEIELLVSFLDEIAPAGPQAAAA
jgi:ParB/RepB/Spo0J family partition protein